MEPALWQGRRGCASCDSVNRITEGHLREIGKRIRIMAASYDNAAERMIAKLIFILSSSAFQGQCTAPLPSVHAIRYGQLVRCYSLRSCDMVRTARCCDSFRFFALPWYQVVLAVDTAICRLQEDGPAGEYRHDDDKHAMGMNMALRKKQKNCGVVPAEPSCASDFVVTLFGLEYNQNGASLSNTMGAPVNG
jgi:hypothetical protein